MFFKQRYIAYRNDESQTAQALTYGTRNLYYIHSEREINNVVERMSEVYDVDIHNLRQLYLMRTSEVYAVDIHS